MLQRARLDELIEQARAGSDEAFAKLVRPHLSAVRGYINRYVHNDEIADDLAQTSLITAFRKLGTFRGDAAFRTWLIGIARRTTLAYLRDEARRRAREARGLDALLAAWRRTRAEPEEGEVLDHEQRMKALQSCIDSLPAESLELVRRHYFQGDSVASIARDSDRGESALRMALLRVRRALRKCVEGRLAIMENRNDN